MVKILLKAQTQACFHLRLWASRLWCGSPLMGLSWPYCVWYQQAPEEPVSVSCYRPGSVHLENFRPDLKICGFAARSLSTKGFPFHTSNSVNFDLFKIFSDQPDDWPTNLFWCKGSFRHTDLQISPYSQNTLAMGGPDMGMVANLLMHWIILVPASAVIGLSLSCPLGQPWSVFIIKVEKGPFKA